MRKIHIILSVLLLSAIPIQMSAQNSSGIDPVHGTRNVQSDTLTFTVYGMDCPGCEGGLEKQVNKIPSIKFSNADWVKQELKIVLVQDSILNLKELEKRVKKANFTLKTSEKDKK